MKVWWTDINQNAEFLIQPSTSMLGLDASWCAAPVHESLKQWVTLGQQSTATTLLLFGTNQTHVIVVAADDQDTAGLEGQMGVWQPVILRLLVLSTALTTSLVSEREQWQHWASQASSQLMETHWPWNCSLQAKSHCPLPQRHGVRCWENFMYSQSFQSITKPWNLSSQNFLDLHRFHHNICLK